MDIQPLAAMTLGVRTRLKAGDIQGWFDRKGNPALSRAYPPPFDPALLCLSPGEYRFVRTVDSRPRRVRRLLSVNGTDVEARATVLKVLFLMQQTGLAVSSGASAADDEPL